MVGVKLWCLLSIIRFWDFSLDFTERVTHKHIYIYIYIYTHTKGNYYNYNMLLLPLLPLLLLLKNLKYYSYTTLLLLNEGFIQGSFLQRIIRKAFHLSLEAMEQHKQHLIIRSSITFLNLSFNFLPLLPMSSYFSHSPLSNIPPSVHSYTACIFPRSPPIIS